MSGGTGEAERLHLHAARVVEEAKRVDEAAIL